VKHYKKLDLIYAELKGQDKAIIKHGCLYGHTVFYVKNRQCVQCNKDRIRKFRSKNNA
jgi:hypothetical protein